MLWDALFEQVNEALEQVAGESPTLEEASRALDAMAAGSDVLRKYRQELALAQVKPAVPPNCECQGGLVPAPWEGERHQLGAPCSVFPVHSEKMEHIGTVLGRVLAKVAQR
jgi:hypothetical protein